MINSLFTHPYGTRNNGHQVSKQHTPMKKTHKNQKERRRLEAKASSPGVPPNSCPYIDLVKTIIEDMSVAYDRLYEKGEHQPKLDDLKQLADDQLEYIRRSNECLRDNSGYWYEQYKILLNK